MANQIKRSEIAEEDLYKDIRESAKQTLITIDNLNKGLKNTAIALKQDLLKPLKENITSIEKLQKTSKLMDDTMKQSIQIEKAKSDALKSSLKAEQELEKLKQQKIKTASQEAKEQERLNKLNEKAKKIALEEGNAYKQLSKEASLLKSESKRLGAELLNLEKKGKKHTVEFRKLELQYNKVTREAQKTDNKLKKLDKTVGDSQRNVGNYQGAVGKLSGAFASLGLSIGGAMILRNVFGVVKDFDQAQANLASVLGVSRVEMEGLTVQAKELGATTRFTASQVSELQLELSKLGFNQDQIKSMTKSVLNLAGATGTDLGQTATVVGATLRAFGLRAEDVGRITDVMAKSFSSSALDMSKFTTAMAIVAPVAKSAGVNIEETTAMLGALVDNGIDASTAGTGLRNIFLDLTKHGITLEDALSQIRNATDMNAVSLELFGKRGATIGTVLATQTDRFKELTDTLYLSAGATDEMADKMLNTLGGSLDLLSSAWEGYILNVNDANNIGNKLRDGIKFLADNLATILNLVSRGIEIFIKWKAVVFLSTQANKLFASSFIQVAKNSTFAQASLTLFKNAIISVKGAVSGLANILKTNIFGVIVLAIYEMHKALNVVNTEAKQFETINSNLRDISNKTASSYAEEKVQLDLLVDQIKDSNYENGERARLIEQLNKKYGTNLSNIKDEDTLLKELNKTYKLINTQIEKRLELEEVRQRFSLITSEITKLNTANLQLQEGISSAWGKNAFSEFLQGFGDYENTRGVLTEQLDENKKVLDKLTAQRDEIRLKLLDLLKKEAQTSGVGTSTKKRTASQKEYNKQIKTSYDLEKEMNETLEEKIKLERLFIDIQTKEKIRALDKLIEKEQEFINNSLDLGLDVDLETIAKFIEQKRELLINSVINDTEEINRIEEKKVKERYSEELKRLKEQRDKLLQEQNKSVKKIDEDDEDSEEALEKINENKKLINKEYQQALKDAEKGFNEDLKQLDLIKAENYASSEAKKLEITQQINDEIFKITNIQVEKINKKYERDLKEQELILLKSNKEKKEIEQDYTATQIKLLEERILKLKELNQDTLDLEIQLEKLRQKTVNNEDVAKSFKDEITIVRNLTEVYNHYSDRRIEKINEEIEAIQRRYDTLSGLAESGNILARESLAEEAKMLAEANRKREQEEKRKQRIQLASTVLQTYLTNSQNPQVKNPLSKTITDTVLLTEFIKSLPAFFDGTEDTGKNGNGIDNKGGFLSVLHPNERVVTAKQNELIGGMSNEELSKLAYNYQNGMIRPITDTALSNGFAGVEILAKKLDSLERTIANKPEHTLQVEQIISGAMAITRTTKQGNTKIYNRYRVS